MADFISSPVALVAIGLGVLAIAIVLLVVWIVSLDRRMRGVVDGLEAERRKVAEMQMMMGRRASRGYGAPRGRASQRPPQGGGAVGAAQRQPAKGARAQTQPAAQARTQAQAQGQRPLQNQTQDRSRSKHVDLQPRVTAQPAATQTAATAQDGVRGEQPRAATAQARAQRQGQSPVPSPQAQQAAATTREGFADVAAVRKDAADAEARRAAERTARQQRMAARRQQQTQGRVQPQAQARSQTQAQAQVQAQSHSQVQPSKSGDAVPAKRGKHAR